MRTLVAPLLQTGGSPGHSEARKKRHRELDAVVLVELKLGKKVVGVYQGKPPRELPPAAREQGIKLVRWSEEGIAKELK